MRLYNLVGSNLKYLKERAAAMTNFGWSQWPEITEYREVDRTIYVLIMFDLEEKK